MNEGMGGKDEKKGVGERRLDGTKGENMEQERERIEVMGRRKRRSKEEDGRRENKGEPEGGSRREEDRARERGKGVRMETRNKSN